MDISAWLKELGLERYDRAFQENEIDAEILPNLTADDLNDMGVVAVGHRRKLLKAIAALAEAKCGRNTERDAEAKTVPITTATEAERRQVTVLFCDLVGSTELSTKLDPEDMGELLRTYQTNCADVVNRWGGHVANYMGDGVLAYFGWPQAHEDGAERAVRCGLDLTERIAGLVGDGGVPLAARIGIATGLVMVGEVIGSNASQEDTVVGETPNLAARLQALAEARSVVIDTRCRELVGSLFNYADLGPCNLKGFAAPIQAWRVIGDGRVESRFEALHGQKLPALVGREHELGLLRDRWEKTEKGEGQVVLLSGEPGIGKSRIVRALEQRISDQPRIVLNHFCSPYHTDSVLYPVIQLLKRAASFGHGSESETRLDKLEALLARGAETLTEVVPLVAALLQIETGDRYPPLALSPQYQKQRTLEVLVDHVEGLAAAHPVMVIFEDVHWADATTLEMLALLIERSQRLPILVLITFRAGFYPPWSNQGNVLQLSLARLTQHQAQTLVDEVIGNKELPEGLVDEIVAKSDGVPLFVEELTKTTIESEVLIESGGRYELARPLPELKLPATLQDSLLARLDRLGPAKDVAQLAATIGREFTYDLLQAVSSASSDQLVTSLDQLMRMELVICWGAPPTSSYSFKHALIQEAAHQSILKSKRRRLHAQIASVLERQFLDTSPEVLAYHLTEAGDVKKAVTNWKAAGELAIHRSGAMRGIG